MLEFQLKVHKTCPTMEFYSTWMYEIVTINMILKDNVGYEDFLFAD
jgi:hypothetical protein